MKMMKMFAAASAFAVVGATSALAAEAPSQTPADGMKSVARTLAKTDRSIDWRGGALAGSTSADMIKVAQRRFRRGGRGFRRGRGRRGRSFGRGLAIGAGAALILGLAANASAADYRRSCRRLWRRCDNGNWRACERAEDAGC